MAIQKPPSLSEVEPDEATPSASPRPEKDRAPIAVWRTFYIGVLIVVLIGVVSNTAMFRFLIRKMDNRYRVNDFNLVKLHMSENEVRAILGDPVEVRSSRDCRSHYCDHYLVWKSGRNEIVVAFTKGEATYAEGTFTTLTGEKTSIATLNKITFDP